MKNLHEYFLNNSGRVIHKWLHYIDIYERHFQKYAGKSPVVFEIGVFRGGSIQMWKDFFGEGATIVGIDIDPSCARFSDPERGIYVEIGDQADTAFLDSVLAKHGMPDVVIDDGSHLMHHLRETFAHLYPRMKSEGTYLAEDLHCCYWPEHGGGLRAPGSFIELVKEKLDEINALHSRGAISMEFASQTDCVCAYDSVVVFEKRPQGRRQHIQTGYMNSREFTM
jgi:hypothetical protein